MGRLDEDEREAGTVGNQMLRVHGLLGTPLAGSNKNAKVACRQIIWIVIRLFEKAGSGSSAVRV
jgi:hypothetical protein